MTLVLEMTLHVAVLAALHNCQAAAAVGLVSARACWGDIVTLRGVQRLWRIGEPCSRVVGRLQLGTGNMVLRERGRVTLTARLCFIA